MTENAIFHEPESKYCFATGKNTVKLRLRIAREDRPSRIEVIYGGKYDFGLAQLSKEMNIIAKDRLYTYYGAELTLSDLRLTYIFKIYEGEKIIYYSEDGLTDDYDFEFNYYNCFQYSYLNESDIHSAVRDAENAVFYQIFVDRFCRGNTEKDTSYINMDWGDIPTPKSFAGGDLDGITEKLGYISSLGANCIYLTPVFESVSNHKYDTKDYYTVDEMFGGRAALERLVKSAHEMGMKVVLDAVFNHCSELNTLFADVKANGEKSKYRDLFIIDSFSPLSYECFSSCEYMPKFNTSNPDTCRYLIDIAKYWTRELGIDGWRLDVSDEVSHTFWREFRKEIKALDGDCILIGENWHNANVYLRGDQFDSIMNYALTKACLDFFAFGTLDAEGFADKLGELLMRNSDTVNSMMLNLLDSHDTHRFLTRVDGDKEKLMSALAVIFFYPGMPCIYYGTENEMLGGYDPDSRRTFDWSLENAENGTKNLIKTLCAIKQDGDFKYGEFRVLCENGLVIIERVGESKTYRLTVNGNPHEILYETNNAAVSSCAKNVIKPFGFVIETVTNAQK